MAEADLLLRAAALWPGGGLPMRRPGLLAVGGERILAVGREMPARRVIELGDAVLLPGFVCAHQHGRGLPHWRMGFPDDRLEAWINRRRGRGVPDSRPLVLLAAARMLAGGITACLHANWSWGGPQEEELEAAQDAYAEAGIRAALCVGIADRAALLAPEERTAAFLATLPPPLRALAEGLRRHPFPGTLGEAAALRARLLARRPGLPVIFGPAGPQWVSDALLAEVAVAGRAGGVPWHMHLLESPAQAHACRALYPEGTLRRLLALGALGPLASFAHAVFASAEDMALLAESGARVVLNPGSNLRLGNGPPPVAALRRAGVRLALGGDDCELNDDRDPWGELRLAVALSRSGDRASPPGMTAAEALAMATEEGALAMGLSDAGRLRPGWLADVVALRPARDEAALLAGASGREVVLTMVGGRVLYREGRFPHLSLPVLEQAALAAARAAAVHPTREAAAVEALGRRLLAFLDAAD